MWASRVAQHVAEGIEAIRKGGTCVVTGIGTARRCGDPRFADFADLVSTSASRGHCSAARTRPRTFRSCSSSIVRAGSDLDELVTRNYRLEDINQGYSDMHAGINIRGVILHEQ